METKPECFLIKNRHNRNAYEKGWGRAIRTENKVYTCIFGPGINKTPAWTDQSVLKGNEILFWGTDGVEAFITSMLEAIWADAGIDLFAGREFSG